MAIHLDQSGSPDERLSIPAAGLRPGQDNGADPQVAAEQTAAEAKAYGVGEIVRKIYMGTLTPDQAATPAKPKIDVVPDEIAAEQIAAKILTGITLATREAGGRAAEQLQARVAEGRSPSRR